MEVAGTTFPCYHCGCDSGFSKPVLDYGGFMLERDTESQERIYKCEFCRTENRVQNTRTGWRSIDEGAPSDDARRLVAGKPEDETPERTRLEQNFDSLQKLSLGLGVAAISLG